MAEPVCPDVMVYVCRNAIPEGGRLPRQWKQDGVHVLVREVPCSGKIDAQYLFHALEGGVHGVCVVACPKTTLCLQNEETENLILLVKDGKAHVLKSELCDGCGMCIEACPVRCIRIIVPAQTEG